MRPKQLTVAEIEYAAFKLAEEFMTWDEPIPGFGTRFPNILESCLVTPFMRFSNKDLYRGIVNKAAIMFYFLIKNHPFQNGNKRIAVMSLLYFLYKNEKWLKINEVELYDFARGIARSKPRSKERIVSQIQDMIRKYMVNLKS